MNKPHIEISIPGKAYLKTDINNLFDVYLAMIFLTTYFIEEHKVANVSEVKAESKEG
ncbi:hypothetical protein ABI223_01885 [Acinetobacter pittii]|uniref:hypothetical protein n=1 Tax=Acinetobacter pittii TaxID=48296 RepID=UPI003267664A